MYVVAVYDICTMEKDGQRRLTKVMKTFRKYLHHTQKSVFEGEISQAKLMGLQMEVKRIIKVSEDYVVFFRIDNPNNVKRDMLGLNFDPTSQII